MALLADATQPPRSAFLSFLREELALRPGRVAAVLRIAGSCTLVVAIAMLYQIPAPDLVVYIVFLISRDEAASTLLTGLFVALAVTVGVALSLVFCMLDASEPALRLPLMAGSTFVALFLARTMALGPLAFMAGFILMKSQAMIDEIPSLEALTRSVLWLWVVAIVPDTLTVLVNLAFGESPARLGRRTVLRLLGALAMALRSGDTAPLQRHQVEAIGLVELRHRAGMFDRDLRTRAAIDTILIETLAALLTLTRMLPAGTPIEARLPLAAACEETAAAYERDDAAITVQNRPTDAVLRALSPQARPVVVAMAKALAQLSDGVARRRAPTDLAGVPPAKSMFVPDAFSNPEYVQFALKTTIAAMASYFIYSILNWPGISTSITTCLFVALGTLGETVYKLILRIVGALIGGLAAGLCIVFLVPEMTNIGQLCLLIASVSIICAWVATSSDRLSYVGIQMAFAFFLGVLHGFGPPTDLTVLRDRVVGILLGNVLISVVFSVLWPTSAVDRARSTLAAALRTLSELLTGDARSEVGGRLALLRALSEARRFVSIAAFELQMLAARAWQGSGEGLSLDTLDRLAGATFVVVGQQGAFADLVHPQDEVASKWLVDSADRISVGERTTVDPDEFSGFGRALAALSEDAPVSLRAALEARLILKSEIENAVASRA